MSEIGDPLNPHHIGGALQGMRDALSDTQLHIIFHNEVLLDSTFECAHLVWQFY